MNNAGDETVRADLAALPGWLNRIDDWIAEGVLGKEPPNAADLQIGASLPLAMTFDDLRPAIEGRPAGRLALRAIPDFPGRAAPVLPPAWIGRAPSERAGRLDSLIATQRVQRIGQRRPIGKGQAGVELEQRLEHEATGSDLGVGKRETIRRQLEVVDEQQIDVERARSVARAARRAPALDLDRLAEVQ